MPWLSLASAAVGAYGAKQKADAAQAGAGMAGQPGMKSDGRTVETVFDNSGWNVSFGSSKIDSTAVKSVDQAGPSLPQSQASSMGNPLAGLGQSLPAMNETTLVYVAIAAVVLIAWKKKKS